MSQPCRWVSRIARVAMAVGTVVLFGAGSLAAQGTTGKLEGTVRDQAGAPVAGAQVLIVGSAFAGVTNEQGYYFINNVPAGVVTVRAQYIGYAPAEVRNVRILAGQTLTQGLTLSQQAVTVEGITVEVAVNPLVPRDQVSSKPIVGGETIEDLPVDAVSQVLRLQPGVVESARGLTVRGSRPGQTAVYIDGVQVRSVSGNTGASGSGTALVGTNALEEASVTTGAVGAEMGDAQAGVISLVTRSGGSNYSGSISFATDEVSGQTYGGGINRMEASFGGPLMRNLTFFLASTMQGAQNGLQGKGANEFPSYVLNGIDTVVTVATTPGDVASDSESVVIPRFAQYGTGSRRPNQASDDWTMDAKLRYSYGTGSSLSLTYHRVREQNRFNYGFNPQSARGSLNSSRAWIFNWAQNLARSSERALFLEARLSFQHDQFMSGLIDPQWIADNRTGDIGNFTFGTMQFVNDFDDFPINDRLIYNLRVNNCMPDPAPASARCIPYLDRNDLAAAAPYRTSPYGLYFASQGIGTGGPTLYEETRVIGSAAVDWQANRYNRIRFGGDFWSADSDNYASGSGNSLVDVIFLDAKRFSPTRLGLFATDRLDLGDVVVDLGIRYDRLSTGLLYAETPGRLFSDIRKDGNLNWLYPDGSRPTAHDTAVATRCSQLLAANDSVGWSTCNFFEAEPRSTLTPSLRVSFPVTDRTNFRLSYAQQVQSPNFELLASNANTDLSFTNTNDLFGRDLDFGKAILFEFGIRHAFSDDMVLDVSAYNRDVVSEPTVRIVPLPDMSSVPAGSRLDIMNINLYTNADFGTSRGIDMRLDRRIGSLFNGTISYTFMSSKSTGSDPTEYINTVSRVTSAVTGDRSPPPQALVTTRDNRTHTIAGSLQMNFPHDFRSGTLLGSVLQDVGMNATFRFASGLAYTRMLNTGSGATGPGNAFGLSGQPLEGLNQSTMPWIKNVDLRINRGFRVAGTDMTVFADMRNLFNWTNLTRIFAETGDVVNEVNRDAYITSRVDALRLEAGNARETRTVNGAAVAGYDLTGDCTQYRPAGLDHGDRTSIPNCLLLRNTERTFGDGDGFLDDNEVLNAFTASYNSQTGPWTFRGPGFNMRLGFELNF